MFGRLNKEITHDHWYSDEVVALYALLTTDAGSRNFSEMQLPEMMRRRKWKDSKTYRVLADMEKAGLLQKIRQRTNTRGETIIRYRLLQTPCACLSRPHCRCNEEPLLTQTKQKVLPTMRVAA